MFYRRKLNITPNNIFNIFGQICVPFKECETCTAGGGEWINTSDIDYQSGYSSYYDFKNKKVKSPQGFTAEQFNFMKKSGLTSVMFGVESGSQRMLDFMVKKMYFIMR